MTSEQKQENREISKFRVLVEHAICGAKRCRIVKDHCLGRTIIVPGYEATFIDQAVKYNFNIHISDMSKEGKSDFQQFF